MSALDQIGRALRLVIRRGTVALATLNPARTLLQLNLRAGEVKSGVELLLPYGMSAMPDAGDVVLLQIGAAPDHFVALTADNPALRIAGMVKGEFGFKNLFGVMIYLSKTGLVVNGGGMNVTIEGAPQVIVNGGDVVASNISLVNHVHGGVEAGGANTGPPTG